MISRYFQSRNRVKGINGWRITKRRHQGCRGIPAHWANGILAKDRARTQTSKVGDKKHIDQISRMREDLALFVLFFLLLLLFLSKTVLDKPKIRQGPRSRPIWKENSEEHDSNLVKKSLSHRVDTKWDIVSLFSCTSSPISQIGPVQKGMERKSHRMSPSFVCPWVEPKDCLNVIWA